MSDNRQLLGGPSLLNPPSSRGPLPSRSTGGPIGSSGEVQHVCYLSEHIGALYLNDNYSDVVLNVENSQFKAHKVILAARSEYFRALLFGGMLESGLEEITIQDTNVAAFQILLRYIYTGRVTLTNLKEEIILEILGLAHKFGFSELETSVSEYLKAVLNTRNLCTVFGASHLYSLSSLETHCLEFADRHAGEILTTDGFLHLSASAVEQIISRDSFCASEIEVFKAVREWKRVNPEVDSDSIMAQIRLPLMKLEDLLNTVRPSGLIHPDLILDSIKEQTEKRDMELRYRGFLMPDGNVALPSQGAQVIEGELKQALLNGDSQNYDMERGFTRHPIEANGEGIVIQLGSQCIINHIRLLLWDRDQRSYSYYIEVSMDKKDWVRVIDYSHYLCRAWQKLYFPPKVVKYIRIMGTHNTVNRVFHLVAMEAYYTSHQYNFDKTNGILIPTENVATIEGSASVIEGVSRSRNALLNGDTENYDWDSGYTCHQLGSGAIVIQLPQPYLIDSMRLLLWDCDDRSYSYYIEVSTDQSNWKLVADKTKENCKSWQYLKFQRQPVTLIRIVGTHNSANEVFHCVHFEPPVMEPFQCPATVHPSLPPSPAASSSGLNATDPSNNNLNQIPPFFNAGGVPQPMEGNPGAVRSPYPFNSRPSNAAPQPSQAAAGGFSANHNAAPPRFQNIQMINNGPNNNNNYMDLQGMGRGMNALQVEEGAVGGINPNPFPALGPREEGAGSGSNLSEHSSVELSFEIPDNGD